MLLVQRAGHSRTIVRTSRSIHRTMSQCAVPALRRTLRSSPVSQRPQYHPLRQRRHKRRLVQSWYQHPLIDVLQRNGLPTKRRGHTRGRRDLVRRRRDVLARDAGLRVQHCGGRVPATWVESIAYDVHGVTAPSLVLQDGGVAS
jgi:hypothetical protein